MTFGDLKASRTRDVLGVCPDDPRFAQWANEAQSLMLNQGRFWGSVIRAQFCVTDGCIVLAREIGTVEQLALCGTPVKITNNWYNFQSLVARVESCDGCSTGNCSGGRCNRCGSLHAEDHNPRVSFSTTLGVDNKIRTYLTVLSDVGKKIIFQGRDLNGIWVRTLIDGVMSDGEQVTLANPFVDTVTVWGAGNPVGVIKEPTAGRVEVYSILPATAAERLLAKYQPSETRPMYRSLFIPGLSGVTCCGCTDTDSDTSRRTVTAIVSLQHIPIEVDNDWLIFQNLPAYKAAMIAVKAWEGEDSAKGNYHFYGTQAAPKNGRNSQRVVNRGGAIPLLQAELRKMTGDRVETMVYLEETNGFQRQMAGFR